MDYRNEMHLLKEETDAELNRLFAKTFMPQQESAVAKAAAYSLLSGGKRIRGVLALQVCKLLCGETLPAKSYAAAVEMLHCYSLIHDDLPCMDNDDFRRGQPSCHKAFGEATALLAADALLTASFETLCLNQNAATQNAQAVKTLAGAAGARGMVYGQELDLAAELCPVDEAGLLKIHENKTGQLIHAAVLLGAIAGKATPEQQAALEKYAWSIGLVFQIVDDILDVTSSAEALGKPVGSDAQNHKTTFVTLKGVSAAQAQARHVTAHAQETLTAVFGCKADFLCTFAEELLQRKN